MVSARSVSVSPMPTSSPVVNGMDSRPASSSVRSRTVGILVRAAVMRQPLGLEQPPRRGLQHHAHRRGHRLEPRQLRPAHHARVQVRQQPGLLQHADRHRPHVVQRRVVAAFVEPLPGFVPARLRAVAEREKRFLATQFGAAAGHVEDLVGLHVHAHALGAQLARHRDERAVVAGIAAQMGDGNEHLARVADRQPAVRAAPTRGRQARVADPGRAGAQSRPGRRRGRSSRWRLRRRSAPPRRGPAAALAAGRQDWAHLISVGPPGWAERRRAGGSEPLPCNPGVVENHPRVSLSETTAPGISATVVPGLLPMAALVYSSAPRRARKFPGVAPLVQCRCPHLRLHTDNPTRDTLPN